MLKFSKFLVSLSLTMALLAACSSSGDSDSEMSEEDAEERIAEVLDVFESAADDDGFSEDDDDESSDSDFECEGFEAFNDDDESTIADDEYAVTDNGEPEVAGTTEDEVIFEGGEVTGSVSVGVTNDDTLAEGLDAVLDDPDGFEDCLIGAMEDSFAEGDAEALDGADFELDVSVDEGDRGDQEIVIELDGELTGETQGLEFAFELTGEFRLVRIGQAGIVATATAVGVDIDTGSLDAAIDAAIDEFESQFG